MNNALYIEFPSELMEFVRLQTHRKGLPGAEEYIRHLVESAQAEEVRAEIAAAIDAGLATPLMDVTPSHWEQLRSLVEQRAAGARKE